MVHPTARLMINRSFDISYRGEQKLEALLISTFLTLDRHETVKCVFLLMAYLGAMRQ